MRALVLYDSYFGNTKTIAEAISIELGENVSTTAITDFQEIALANIDLLVVGSPIIGWKPSEKIAGFLEKLHKDQLQGVKAAAFDTRVKLFIHGDAASKISAALKNAGAAIISPPHAFYVQGKEGPLLNGEVERAKEWAKSIRMK